jgi:hypothetical protein
MMSYHHYRSGTIQETLCLDGYGDLDEIMIILYIDYDGDDELSSSPQWDRLY